MLNRLWRMMLTIDKFNRQHHPQGKVSGIICTDQHQFVRSQFFNN